jgi:hypothetical protein
MSKYIRIKREELEWLRDKLKELEVLLSRKLA